ncbi:hypothetical protein MC7420_6448 [Coleofasciculus chthonoplastes PCC 7420]|uniref:Uncharacterized protein n=1 Tax=Coleofasciculus chthonoplastes PCC 7420 TaxID=118168 RepID=B4VQP1_9CYAN|nr:hypothetical protein [Coleofasciculus chthonoplastes]EDX75793.1 hypothetical protein MC7420_6448 [Coleofasciculus chthonoplastes PCC 7420]
MSSFFNKVILKINKRKIKAIFSFKKKNKYIFCPKKYIYNCVHSFFSHYLFQEERKRRCWGCRGDGGAEGAGGDFP